MTEVEIGLASHSHKMIAPCNFHCESEDGLIVVISKKTLCKQNNNKNKKYISKIKKKKKIATVVADTVKSTSFNDSSWASIVKKSLKMNIPKFEYDMRFSESESSSPEVSFSE